MNQHLGFCWHTKLWRGRIGLLCHDIFSLLCSNVNCGSDCHTNNTYPYPPSHTIRSLFWERALTLECRMVQIITTDLLPMFALAAQFAKILGWMLAPNQNGLYRRCNFVKLILFHWVVFLWSRNSDAWARFFNVAMHPCRRRIHVVGSLCPGASHFGKQNGERMGVFWVLVHHAAHCISYMERSDKVFQSSWPVLWFMQGT